MKKNVWKNEHCRKYDPSTEGYGNTENWANAFKNRFDMIIDIKEDSFFSNINDVIELKKEYNRLLKIYHPDINGDTEENINKTREIISLYEIRKSIIS